MSVATSPSQFMTLLFIIERFITNTAYVLGEMLTTQLLSMETMGGSVGAASERDPHIQLVFHASLPE